MQVTLKNIFILYFLCDDDSVHLLIFVLFDHGNIVGFLHLSKVISNRQFICHNWPLNRPDATYYKKFEP